MTVVFHREFIKRYKRLSQKQQVQFKKRLVLFEQDPFHPTLRNHRLQGEYGGYHSINISGDLRAIYEEVNDTTQLFVVIGTHSELYD